VARRGVVRGFDVAEFAQNSATAKDGRATARGGRPKRARQRSPRVAGARLRTRRAPGPRNNPGVPGPPAELDVLLRWGRSARPVQPANSALSRQIDPSHAFPFAPRCCPAAGRGRTAGGDAASAHHAGRGPDSGHDAPCVRRMCSVPARRDRGQPPGQDGPVTAERPQPCVFRLAPFDSRDSHWRDHRHPASKVRLPWGWALLGLGAICRRRRAYEQRTGTAI
jgi:hypothetical protein